MRKVRHRRVEWFPKSAPLCNVGMTFGTIAACNPKNFVNRCAMNMQEQYFPSYLYLCICLSTPSK